MIYYSATLVVPYVSSEDLIKLTPPFASMHKTGFCATETSDMMEYTDICI